MLGMTEPKTAPRPATSTKARLLPPYNVVLLDDDHHTYEYVIEMLHVLFGHTPQTAFLMALEVDTTGRVIVYTGPLEVAELKRDQIHAYGKDPRHPQCAGSMSAVIEPAG